MHNSSSPFLALKIGHRYFKEKNVEKKGELPAIAEKLETQYQFLSLIIKELKKYSELVNVKVREDIAAHEAKDNKEAFDDTKLHEKIYSSVFDHKEQI